MAMEIGPSISFTATTGAAGYPLRTKDGTAAANSPNGTTTAGSSALITSRVIALESVIIERVGSANGTITISDHAGTAATQIVLDLLFAAPQVYHYGPYGIEVPWTGIKCVVTGTAATVRVVCRSE